MDACFSGLFLINNLNPLTKSGYFFNESLLSTQTTQLFLFEAGFHHSGPPLFQTRTWSFAMTEERCGTAQLGDPNVAGGAGGVMISVGQWIKGPLVSWFTPWKFNSSPLKIYHPKRKVGFQPSFIRGYVKLRVCRGVWLCILQASFGSPVLTSDLRFRLILRVVEIFNSNLHSLKSSENRPFAPKGNDRLPTIHVQLLS